VIKDMFINAAMKHKYIKYISFSVIFFGLLGIVAWQLAVVQDKCSFQPDGYQKWNCLSPYFEELTNSGSTAAAMEEAIKLKEDRVVADCHLFGHVIGETALEKYDFDTGQAFSSCILGCSNGCFHGVVERFIRNEPDPYDALSKIQNMCDGIDEENDWLSKRNCIHGVGHGLLAHEYLSLEEAIDACEVFDVDGSSWSWPSFCKGGLVMEYMDQYLLLDLDESDFREMIPKVCARIEDIESELVEVCLDVLSLGILYNTGYDLRRSEDLCEELPDPGHVETCRILLFKNVMGERPSILKGF